jgi:electron transport complex protein RnfG
MKLVHDNDSRWLVKKDGGMFDQFTGATITPRAVVKAVRNTVSYFNAHQSELFEANSNCPSQKTAQGTK